MVDLTAFDIFIFDLDGTLIDSESFHSDAFAQAVRELTGYALTPAERREFFKSHTKSFYPVLAERHRLTADVEAVFDRKRALVKERFVVEPIPGAMEFLRKWHNQKRFGTVSNSAREFVVDALRELAVLSWFELVLGGDQIDKKKPHPQPYLQAIKTMGVSPEKVLVFEDTIHGAQSATAAGCATVFIETGAQRDRHELPAHAYQLSWDELLEL
jgi:HAD superfamily hydrolase (TIGR01509 family)